MEKEQQKELSKILGIRNGFRNEEVASWAEIYREIGKLQERGNNHFCPSCTLPHYPPNNLLDPPYTVTCGGAGGAV